MVTVNFMKNNFEEKIVLYLFIFFSLQIIPSAIYLYDTFPYVYTWSEIFIKYTDGEYVRRGLLGFLLYHLADQINIQLIWTIFEVILYFLFFVLSYFFLKKWINPFFTFLFLFSPALFSFIIRERIIFGRKDIFILIFVFLTIILLVRTILDDKNKYLYLFFSFLSYIVSFLIHEMTIFFMIPSTILLLIAFKDNIKVYLLILILLLIASVYLTIMGLGTDSLRIQMFADWVKIYPDLKNENAIGYIGKGIGDIEKLIDYLPYYNFRIGCLFAFILANIPIALFFYAYNIHSIFVSILGKRYAILSYIFYFIPTATITIMTCDFSRCLSYSCIFFILFSISMIIIYRVKFGMDIQIRGGSIFSLSNPTSLVVAFIYIFSWIMPHWVPMNAKTSLFVDLYFFGFWRIWTSWINQFM